MASGRSSQNNRTKNTAKTTAKKSGTTSKSRDTKGPSKKGTAARRTSGGNTRTAGGSKSRNQSGKKPTVVDTRTEQVTDYRVGQEIRICITAVISILLLLGLLGVGGRAGRFVSDALFGSFGLMAYVFPFLLFFAHAFFVANRTNQLIGRKMIGLFLCFLFLCAFMQLLTVGYIKVTDVGEYFRVAADDHTGGGFVGGMNGATMGADNTTIAARNGEMIMNANQQRALWDMLNGAGTPAGAGGVNLTINNSAANLVTAQPQITRGQIELMIDARVNDGLRNGRFNNGLNAANASMGGDFYGS